MKSQPAFPRISEFHAKELQGMSLRTYIATKAMQALVSRFPFPLPEGYSLAENTAERAYNMAEAMLKEEAKREKE